ncbi:hypothetical protein RJ641_016517 [Dillenia turbinata]|uniref:Uncharacterized protein n=1 Tax=Dillenia turbinata TaxID=194707 RepID=A0AAN8UM72_9MAGN
MLLSFPVLTSSESLFMELSSSVAFVHMCNKNCFLSNLLVASLCTNERKREEIPCADMSIKALENGIKRLPAVANQKKEGKICEIFHLKAIFVELAQLDLFFVMPPFIAFLCCIRGSTPGAHRISL